MFLATSDLTFAAGRSGSAGRLGLPSGNLSLCGGDTEGQGVMFSRICQGMWRGHRGSNVKRTQSHVLQGFPGNTVKMHQVPCPEQLCVNCLLFLYTLSSYYSYFIAASNKLSLSQPVIFTILCLWFSTPATEVGGEELEAWRCLRCFSGNMKLRNTIPKPWHSTLRSHGPKASRQVEKYDKWSNHNVIEENLFLTTDVTMGGLHLKSMDLMTSGVPRIFEVEIFETQITYCHHTWVKKKINLFSIKSIDHISF